MRDARASFGSSFARFAEMGFDEGAMFSAEAGKGMKGLANARALGPAGARSGGESDDRDFPIGE